MEKKYVVYIHQFPNKKVYVGISNDYKRRWKNGFGYKRAPRIYNAIKKYGWDNIKHQIVYKDISKEIACELEVKLIKLYNSNNKKFGYNLTSGGEVSYTRNEEQIDKLRERSKGNKYSQYRIVSEETRKRMSASAKKRFSEKQKKNLIELHNKKVNQYDLNGNFIKTWNSGTEFAKSIGKNTGSMISKCCNKVKGHSTAYGFKWEFTENGG